MNSDIKPRKVLTDDELKLEAERRVQENTQILEMVYENLVGKLKKNK